MPADAVIKVREENLDPRILSSLPLPMRLFFCMHDGARCAVPNLLKRLLHVQEVLLSVLVSVLRMPFHIILRLSAVHSFVALLR